MKNTRISLEPVLIHSHWAKANTFSFRCSMWTLNWIPYQPVWKQCRFCFRTNTYKLALKCVNCFAALVCEQDVMSNLPRRKVVPIIVAACLAGLIIIIIVAYFISKNIGHSAYRPMAWMRTRSNQLLSHRILITSFSGGRVSTAITTQTSFINCLKVSIIYNCMDEDMKMRILTDITTTCYFAIPRKVSNEVVKKLFIYK